MRTITGLLVFGVLSILAPNAHAIRFANNFIEFELPTNWKCVLEAADWVCQSLDEKKKRDAIIVLAAKLKGDKDTPEEYQKYLEKPRAFTGAGGKPVTSQPKYAQYRTLNGQLWVDSLHLDSEIPNYYTRYLATAMSGIGVLVTYSVHKEKYALYDKQFEDMISTLKVFRRGPLLAQQPYPATIGIGDPIRMTNIAQPPGQAAPPQVTPSGIRDSSAPRAAAALLVLLTGVGAVFHFLRRRS